MRRTSSVAGASAGGVSCVPITPPNCPASALPTRARWIGLPLKSLAFAIVVLLWTVVTASAQTACTHFISPSGSGNGLTQSSPMGVSTFWSAAAAGSVGCLLDGTYPTLSPPSGTSGDSGKPITLRALNDGAVLVDGGGSRIPIWLNGNNWLVVEGMDAANSVLGGGGNGTAIGVKGSNNNVFRRVCTWNGGDQNILLWDSSNNLLEDVCAFGQASQSLSEFGLSTRNIYRRVWATWDGFCPPGPTTAMMIFEYAYLEYSPEPHDVSHILSENSIFRWDGRAHAGCRNTNPGISVGVGQRDPYTVHTAPPNRFLGGIAYALGVTPYPSPSDGLFTSKSDNLRQDFIVDTGGASGVFNAMCRRYVGGTLTNDGLWPWPMDSRIKAARSRAGFAPLGGGGTVTSEITSRYGAIPAACQGTPAAAPPASSPPPLSAVAPPTASVPATSAPAPVASSQPVSSPTVSSLTLVLVGSPASQPYS